MDHAARKAKIRARKAHRNTRRPQLVPATELRVQHRFSFLQLSSLNATVPYRSALGEIPTSIGISKTPLQDLARITLQDLRLDESAKGKFLVLRTLEPAYKVLGITTVVEDHEGNAIMFSAYNYTSDPSPNLTDIFPVGTIFLLKEPFCKVSLAQCALVRCDCPSDIVVLHDAHVSFALIRDITWKNDLCLEDYGDLEAKRPKPKTPLAWKDRGNELFNRQKFEHSTHCYLMALQGLSGLTVAKDSLLQIVRSNLSAVYLHRGYFEDALAFAELVLIVDPENRKALCRAGQSCYNLRKFKEAARHFEKWQSLYPGDLDAKNELLKAKERLKEQETGEFSIYKMYLNRAFKSQQDIDCADYVGPVKVIDVPGKGRGVVCATKVDPGALLVVSKALVYSRDPESVVQLGSLPGEMHDKRGRLDLIAHLGQMIKKNPNTFGPVIYDLFDGNQIPKGGSEGLFCDPETKRELIIDVERIRNILVNNCFGEISDEDKHKYDDCFKMPNKLCVHDENGGGLFALPSYFNHSCRPNAVWHIFNDVMFIRAIQFIEEGEEVFLPYFSWEFNYHKRKELCQKRGFECRCPLCQEDRSVPRKVRDKREEIVTSFKQTFDKISGESAILAPGAIHRTMQWICALNATYEGSESLKAAMSSNYMYFLLAKAYSMEIMTIPMKVRKEIECHQNTLKLFGFDPETMVAASERTERLITPNAYLDPQVLFAISKLVFLYNRIEQLEYKSKWVQVLCALEKAYSGGDVNVVKYKYEQIKDLI